MQPYFLTFFVVAAPENERESDQSAAAVETNLGWAHDLRGATFAECFCGDVSHRKSVGIGLRGHDSGLGGPDISLTDRWFLGYPHRFTIKIAFDRFAGFALGVFQNSDPHRRGIVRVAPAAEHQSAG